MKSDKMALTNARLASIQILYMYLFSGESIDKNFGKLKEGVWDYRAMLEGENSSEEETVIEPDLELVQTIIEAYQENEEHINLVIKNALSDPEIMEKLDLILLSILKSAVAESIARPQLDAPILINEYTNIAQSFFDGASINLVNAVLDKIKSLN